MSAPVLVIVVILIAIVAGRLDYDIKMPGSRSILIAISSDQDNAMKETTQSNITGRTGEGNHSSGSFFRRKIDHSR